MTACAKVCSSRMLGPHLARPGRRRGWLRCVEATGAPGPTCTPSTAQQDPDDPEGRDGAGRRRAVPVERAASGAAPPAASGRAGRPRGARRATSDGDRARDFRSSRSAAPSAGSEVAPVDDRVERPARGRRRSPCRGSSGSSARRGAPRPAPPRSARARCGSTRIRATTTRPSSGIRTNATGRETTELVRADQREPDEQAGQDGEQPGHGRAYPRAAQRGPEPVTRLTRRSRRWRDADGRPASGRAWPAPVAGCGVTPEPPQLAAEGLGEQAERDGERRVGHGAGQEVGRRERQHDALVAATTLHQ